MHFLGLPIDNCTCPSWSKLQWLSSFISFWNHFIRNFQCKDVARCSLVPLYTKNSQHVPLCHLASIQEHPQRKGKHEQWMRVLHSLHLFVKKNTHHKKFILLKLIQKSTMPSWRKPITEIFAFYYNHCICFHASSMKDMQDRWSVWCFSEIWT